MIGDAIAHIYIDRHDIKPMAVKESPGFLTGKSGLRLELYALRLALRRGHIAILNDLTNCLRYADLTLIFKGGILRFVEVKDRRVPGTQYPRDERQLQNLRDMADYVLTDKPISLYGYEDWKFHRRALRSHPVHLTREINRAIREAYTVGVVCKEVEDGLFYLVFTSLVEDSRDVMLVIERDGPPVGDAMLFRLSEVREWWPSYFPLMFSIRNPEHWLDIVFGGTSVWVLITVTKLKEAFARFNVTVEVLPPDSDWVLSLSHGQNGELGESKIGSHLMHRIVTEFVSLKWFVEEFAILPPMPDSPESLAALGLHADE